MAKKQSSLYLNGEAVGNGGIRYVKGTQPGLYAPVSQKNVHLTPDFKQFIPRLLESVPSVIDVNSAAASQLWMLNTMALFNRVNVIRDKEGNLRTDFNIQNANTLTNGVYSVALKKGGGAVPVTMGVPDQWVQQADGKWKYRENGSYVRGRWDKIANLWYYFHHNGIMASHEWVENNGNWYYVHGKGNMAVSEWIKWNDDWYYMDKDGRMVKSIRKEIKSKWYYFHVDGKMAKLEVVEDGESGLTYWADKVGVLDEVVMINNWLFGHKKPSRKGGRVAKAAHISTFVDWYAYENVSVINKYVLQVFSNLKAKVGSYDELVDDEGYFWIAVGPRVYNSSYSDNGTLTPGGKGDTRLEMGKYADVVVEISGQPQLYLYCRLGDVKAHTFIAYGNKENGVSQTGIPYPKNSSGEKPDLGSANGNSVEFMGHEGNNGDMSLYKLVQINVFD